MELSKSMEALNRQIEKYLRSGKNYTIFIDIKRSQIVYVKAVDNSKIERIKLHGQTA